MQLASLLDYFSMSPRRHTHLVLIVLMQVHAAFLRFPPPFWHGIIHIGLVYYLGNQLWAVINQRGIRRRYLCRVDRVCRAIFDQKGEEGVD